MYLHPTKDDLKSLKMERLERYIELANMLPSERVALDLDEFLREEAKDSAVPKEGTIESWVYKFKILLPYLDRFPSDFRDYVLGDAVEDYRKLDVTKLEDESSRPHLVAILGALDRYREFRQVREKLRLIARHFKKDTPQWSKFFHGSIGISTTLRMGHGGKLEIHLDHFVETVQGLEAERIRECPVCQRIFWAHPISKMSCSTRCRNLFNVRKHRALMKKNKAHK